MRNQSVSFMTDLKNEVQNLDTTIKQKEKEIADLKAILATLPTDEQAKKAITLYQNEIDNLKKSREKLENQQEILQFKEQAIANSKQQMEERANHAKNIEILTAEVDNLRNILFSLLSEQPKTPATPNRAPNAAIPRTDPIQPAPPPKQDNITRVYQHQNPATPQLKPEDIAEKNQTSKSVVTENSEIAFTNLFSADANLGGQIKVTGGIFLQQLQSQKMIKKLFERVTAIDFSVAWIIADAKRDRKTEDAEWKKIYKFFDLKKINIVRHHNAPRTAATPLVSQQALTPASPQINASFSNNSSLQRSFASARSATNSKQKQVKFIDLINATDNACELGEQLELIKITGDISVVSLNNFFSRCKDDNLQQSSLINLCRNVKCIDFSDAKITDDRSTEIPPLWTQLYAVIANANRIAQCEADYKKYIGSLIESVTNEKGEYIESTIKVVESAQKTPSVRRSSLCRSSVSSNNSVASPQKLTQKIVETLSIAKPQLSVILNDSAPSIPESKSESVVVLPQIPITTEKKYIIDQRSFFAKLFRLNQLEKTPILRLTTEQKCDADPVYTIEYDNKKLFLENAKDFSSQIKNTYDNKPKSFWHRHFPRFFKSEVLPDTVPEILEYVQEHPNKNLVESFSTTLSSFVDEQNKEMEKRNKELQQKENARQKELREKAEQALKNKLYHLGETSAKLRLAEKINHLFTNYNMAERREKINREKDIVIAIQEGWFEKLQKVKIEDEREYSDIANSHEFIQAVQSYISRFNVENLKALQNNASQLLNSQDKRQIEIRIAALTPIAEKFTTLVNAFCNNTLTKNMLDDFIRACATPNIFVLSETQRDDLDKKLVMISMQDERTADQKKFAASCLLPILNYATLQNASVINKVTTEKLQEDAKTLQLEIERIASTKQLSEEIRRCVNGFLEKFPVESGKQNIYWHNDTKQIFALINEIPYTFCNVKRVNDLITDINEQFQKLYTSLSLTGEQSAATHVVQTELEKIKTGVITPLATSSPKSPTNSSVGTAGSDDIIPPKKSQSPTSSSALFRRVGSIGMTGIGAPTYEIAKP